jgi:hypothetical protein
MRVRVHARPAIKITPSQRPLTTADSTGRDATSYRRATLSSALVVNGISLES